MGANFGVRGMPHRGGLVVVGPGASRSTGTFWAVVPDPRHKGRARLPGWRGGGLRFCILLWDRTCGIKSKGSGAMILGTTLCLRVCGTTRRSRARFRTGCARLVRRLGVTSFGQDDTGRWEERDVGGINLPAPTRLTCPVPGSCHCAASYAEYAAPSLGATVSARAAWIDAVAECL